MLCELSIGYDPVAFDYDKDTGIRHLREIKLWEVSVVTWAMNPEATISDYKSARDVTDGVEAIVKAAAAEVKAGRKISAGRLKSLQEASASMKTATKALDTIIKEATETPAKRAAKPQARKSAHYSGPIIEIVL